MPIQITVRPEQLRELGLIRDLGADSLQAIIDQFTRLTPPPSKPADLKKVIEKIVPHAENAEAIVTALMSLYTLIRQRNLSAESLVGGLTDGIITARSRWDERWNEEKLAKWKELQPILTSLLSLSAVETVTKTLDLSYDYTNLLQNAKILTDIRPVFNEDATEIQGAVISHTLRLYYSTFSGSQSLSIALDQDDVINLRRLCERALQKAKIGKSFMLKHGIENAIICGEEE